MEITAMDRYYRYQIKLTNNASSIEVSSYNPDGTLRGNPKGTSAINQNLQQIESLTQHVEGDKTSQNVKELGIELYKSLFPPAVSNDFRSLLKQVEEEKAYVRLEVDLDEEGSPRIATLPWELLYAPQGGGHPSEKLGTHARVILSRRREQWHSASPIYLDTLLRIQLVVSDPRNDVHYKDIELTLHNLAEHNLIAPPLPTLHNPDLQILEEHLEQLLNEGKEPHILHFIGHGRMREGVGELCFVNRKLNSENWVTDEDIAGILQVYQPPIIILQSCESGDLGESLSGVASQMVQRGVPVVIAMQYLVSNIIATTFAEEFYRQLGNLQPVDIAVQKARRQLSRFRDPLAYAIPVLFMQVQNGQIFRIQKKQTFASQLAKISNQPKPFTKDITESYPYPVAQACFNFNDNIEVPTRSFIAFDQLINHLIKYLATIFLGQTQYDNNPNYPLPQSLLWMRRPNLEMWVEQLIHLNKIYQQTSLKRQWQTPGILEACNKDLSNHPEIIQAVKSMTDELNRLPPQNISTVEFLSILVQYRANKWQEGAGTYHSDKARIVIALLHPALSIILEELSIIKEYPLVYLHQDKSSTQRTNVEIIKYMGRSLDLLRIPSTLSIEAMAIKPRRFYIINVEKGTLLNLYPSFVLYEQEVFHLEHHAEGKFVRYRSCTRGVIFEPKPNDTSFFATLFEDETVETMSILSDALVGDEDAWQAEVMLIPSSNELDSIPWTWLGNEAREALEIGLGESLRIGRFWLGLEFLLMGLSKQEGRTLPALLQKFGIMPDRFRGSERSVVAGIIAEGSWKKKRDVHLLGNNAFPDLGIANTQLFEDFNITARHKLVITPRLVTVLHRAHKLAGGNLINHRHLCLACLEQMNSAAVEWLFYTVRFEAGLSHNQIVEQIELIKSEPETANRSIIGFSHSSFPASLVETENSLALPSYGSILESVGRDLTAIAVRGGLGPVEGENANKAMGKVAAILLKQEANNAVLVAEPGIGKTAIVEALAWHLSGQGNKQVIESLRGKRVIEIPVVDLVAGTELRGQLEERVKQLVLEVKAIKDQVIIFIDEIHTILGGSSSSSAMSVANILKPALARGEFPCIGATTLGEYRNHIEKDHALARRFTPVWIDEPSVEEALQIVQKVAQDRLSRHYNNITFTPGAIATATKLSARYLHDRRLPGKAINILDEAASSLLLGDSFSLFIEGQADISKTVTREHVLKILSTHTNIPLKRLAQTDLQLMQELETKLRTRIKGQDEAITDVVRVIKRASFGSRETPRPLGVFLFAGPSGVGKTALGIALAEAIFGDENKIFRIDMSEFVERHQVSRLIGSPPGYIDSEQEGQLTGHLRRNPFTVVLFDEIEKAHWDIHQLFLQLFDYGRLTDSHGNIADGRNAIFIMTTNLGAKVEIVTSSNYVQTVKFAVNEYFSTEFLNRIDQIVYFNSLSEDALAAIFDQHFALSQSMFKEKNIDIKIPQEIKQQIIKYVASQNMGARPLQRFIENRIEMPIIDKIINGELSSNTTLLVGKDIDIGTLTVLPNMKPDISPPSPSIISTHQLLSTLKESKASQHDDSNIENMELNEQSEDNDPDEIFLALQLAENEYNHEIITEDKVTGDDHATIKIDN